MMTNVLVTGTSKFHSQYSNKARHPKPVHANGLAPFSRNRNFQISQQVTEIRGNKTLNDDAISRHQNIHFALSARHPKPVHPECDHGKMNSGLSGGA